MKHLKVKQASGLHWSKEEGKLVFFVKVVVN
jgi:hypothetical protein